MKVDIQSQNLLKNGKKAENGFIYCLKKSNISIDIMNEIGKIIQYDFLKIK